MLLICEVTGLPQCLAHALSILSFKYLFVTQGLL